MDPRFSRRPLGVVVAVSLCVLLLASTPALSAEEPTRGNGVVMTPEPLSHSGDQFTAAVVLPPGVQNVQPSTPSVPLDSMLQRQGEDQQAPSTGSGQALRNGLIHSSRGLQALKEGDRAKAQEELGISMGILLTIPEAKDPHGLRLQLIEETAALKAALFGASPGQVADSRANEEAEDEVDTEEAPALVVPEEEPRLASPESELVLIPEVDFSDFDVPIVLNEQVKAHILYFQTRKRAVMNRAFERAGRYLSMMRGIFRDQGLPLDLVNLAYIESAFNYRAYSRAKASGIWQFIKSTGNRYGMKVSYWLDERRDPEKATRGAAAYLKELYEMFHSWPLALAAYNAGEARIQRAIEWQGTTDFWSLKLPKETQLFVPAFMAATIIAKNPHRYGFAAPAEEPWEVERVAVPGAIALRSIARVVGVPSDVIRDLNPALMRGVTPVHSSAYEVYLPPGTKALLLANLDQMPRSPYREMVRAAGGWHRVRKGETLASIASRRRTTAAVLAELNLVTVGDTLKVGALLQLPSAKPSNKWATTSVRATSSRRSAARTPKVTSSAGSTVHVIKRGDTLWGVARAYAVTPEELRQWNDLKGRARLKPGQALRLRSGQALQVVAQTAKRNREVGRGTPAPTAPVLSAAEGPARYHRVRRGDTLREIARAHDVTPEELRRWNDLGRQAKLRVGQELMIRLSKS